MTESENKIAQYNGILKRLFIQTDALSNVILVPVTTALLLVQLDMGINKNLIFLGLLVAATIGNFFVAYYIFKKVTRDITNTFIKWSEGSEIPDDEYLATQNALFRFPLKQSIMVVGRWILVMPAFILIVHLLADITFLQEFNMWALLLFNVVLSSIIYFRMTERGVEAIAKLGAMNRDIENTEIKKRRLSFPLTYIVLSFIFLTLIFITGAVFNLNHRLIKSLFMGDMKSRSSLIDINVEALLDEKAARVKLLAADAGITRARGIGLHNILMRKLVNEADYYEYAFVATAGAAPVVLSSSAPRLTGTRVIKAEITECIDRSRKGGTSLSGVHLSPLNGKPAMVMCVPLKEGNMVTSVIGLSFNLAAMAESLKQAVDYFKI